MKKKGEMKKMEKTDGKRGGGMMKMHMGERGSHDATGSHEGRCIGGDCKK